LRNSGESPLENGSDVRPEKEHSKQIHALAKLFEDHPEYRQGEGRVSLTLMGGSRNAGDEARLAELRSLAEKLGVKVREIAPYLMPLADIRIM
jgi:hypothetical protein